MASVEVIKPLHGLRGMAACTVLLGHFTSIPTAPSLGVVLFFLLSGFLMGRLYLNRPFDLEEVSGYVFARVGRVYPLFALIVLIAGAISYFAPPAPFGMTPDRIVPHLLLFGDGMTIWTISVEFQFYGLFLLIWYLYGRIPARDVVLSAAVAIFSVTAVVLSADAGRIGLLRYLHLFSGGLLLSVLLRRPVGDLVRRCSATLLPFLILGYGGAFFLIHRFYQHDLVYADIVSCLLCAALIYGVVAAPNAWISRLLCVRPMIWLGEISFGTYLIHRLVQWGLAQLLPNWSGPRMFVLGISLTLILATIVFRWWETPARLFIRRQGEAFRERWLSPRMDRRVEPS